MKTSSPPFGTPENLRDYSTEELMARLECYQFDRLELLDDAETDRTASTVAYLEHRQDVFLAELERRRTLLTRFPQDQRRPGWPDRSTKRYQDLMGLAEELKQMYPIDRFCSELMGHRPQPSGRDRMKVHCFLPGHNDSTPSMILYLRDNRAWCYGCNRGGDIFDLTTMYFGLPHFSDAVRKLAEVVMVDGGRITA